MQTENGLGALYGNGAVDVTSTVIRYRNNVMLNGAEASLPRK
jgi:hypothetical protein